MCEKVTFNKVKAWASYAEGQKIVTCEPKYVDFLLESRVSLPKANLDTQ